MIRIDPREHFSLLETESEIWIVDKILAHKYEEGRIVEQEFDITDENIDNFIFNKEEIDETA